VGSPSADRTNATYRIAFIRLSRDGVDGSMGRSESSARGTQVRSISGLSRRRTTNSIKSDAMTASGEEKLKASYTPRTRQRDLPCAIFYSRSYLLHKVHDAPLSLLGVSKENRSQGAVLSPIPERYRELTPDNSHCVIRVELTYSK
jgi:hypothetical protein